MTFRKISITALLSALLMSSISYGQQRYLYEIFTDFTLVQRIEFWKKAVMQTDEGTEDLSELMKSLRNNTA